MKRVACRLFAERGVDGVTVRDIAEAAGQKNHAAVGYYFGSKEALVRELIIDGAALIDERRNTWLDRLEAEGGPTRVREVVEVLIYPCLDIEPLGREDVYSRFVLMLHMTHRDFFMEVLAGRWNSGYLRCLDHLRRLMPDMPLAMKNHRFVLMGAYLGGVMAARESAMADATRSHPTWSAAWTMSDFAHTMTALLEAPPAP
jgi:AcrR family transcriptional regulator